MRRTFPRFFMVLIFVFGMTGCATSRSHLDLNMPATAPLHPNGRQVYVRSIVDKREFQDNPRSPAIPSLRGRASTASRELKSSAIGRKRNSFGKALGDYVLADGQTVQTVIYQATWNSLAALGYDVTNQREEAKPDAIVMDISIDKFWSWFAPGFSAINIKSDITTTDKIVSSTKGSERTFVIEAHAVNDYQIASNSNWKKTIAAALEEFTSKAKTEFKQMDSTQSEAGAQQ